MIPDIAISGLTTASGPGRNGSTSHAGPFRHNPNVTKFNLTFPYLLKGMTIDQSNQVWSADITNNAMNQFSL
jgi:hypothetical protein